MWQVWKIVRFSRKLPLCILVIAAFNFYLAISIIYFPFWYVFSKLPFHIFYSQLSRISLTRMLLLHSSGMHIKHTHNLFSTTTTTNSCCEQIILSNSTCVGEIYIINIFICINFLWICKIDFRFSSIQTHCYEPFSITTDVYWHYSD